MEDSPFISPRQKQLARLLVLDFTQREASLIMNVEVGSVEQHQNRLYRAVDAKSLAELKQIVTEHPEWFRLYETLKKGRAKKGEGCRRCGRKHVKTGKCRID